MSDSPSSDTGPVRARVVVTLKPGVLDPQGQAIEGALAGLGHTGVGVRQGKLFEITLDDPADAAARIGAMCEALLANTVIEDWRIEWPDGAPGAKADGPPSDA